MTHRRDIMIILILSAVLVCVHDGSASSIGQNNLLDADQQNMTTPTTSPVTASPLCPGKQDLIHVEASDEARKALVGWLAKDTGRLIFIYFDLVVGSLTYHPGSCPDDGMSAIDAQTPLAWVLTSGGPDGGPGAQGSHSFAHAYLTLPVSYPRIYSMGIFEGHYVATLRHEAYRMKIMVANSTSFDAESCWKSLNKTEKSSLMFEVVESFVSNLGEGVTSKNTTSWRMCYSDPTGEDLPFSSSPLIPHTPVYICRDERGSLQRLEQDPFLKGLFTSLIGLSVALQLFVLSKAAQSVKNWLENSSRFELRNGKMVSDSEFFDKCRLPVHVTIGGVLGSNVAFRWMAFPWLKPLLMMAIYFIFYVFWPYYLAQVLLNPSTHTSKFAVSTFETFGQHSCCNSTPWLRHSHASTFNYFFLALISVWTYMYAVVFFPELAPVFLSSLLRAFLKPAASFFRSLSLTYFGQFLFNIRRYSGNREDSSKSERRSLLSILSIFIVEIPHFLLMCLLFFLTEVHFLVFRLPSLIKVFLKESQAKRVRMLVLFLFNTMYLCLIFFPFINVSELLIFTCLSFVCLYITYPTQTLLVITWSVALVKETQNIIQDYRAPLLAVQKGFVEKMKSLMKDHIKREGDEEGSIRFSRLCFEKVSHSGRTVNWKVFCQRSESVWLKVCLQLVTGSKKTVSMSTNLWNEVHCAKHVKKWLDVRKDNRTDDDNSTLEELQKILWMRLLYDFSKLSVLVLCFLSAAMIILSFNSLWKYSNPKNTNVLLLIILVVPFYTFVRGRLSSSSLSDDEVMLVERRFDVDLEKCFHESMAHVCMCALVPAKTIIMKHH